MQGAWADVVFSLLTLTTVTEENYAQSCALGLSWRNLVGLLQS